METRLRFPFPFAANKRKSAVSVFYLQQTDELPFSDNSILRLQFGSGFLEFCGSRIFSELGHGHGHGPGHGHGRGHGNMDEDMEKWTRTWQHGQGHGDMESWTRTWQHGRRHGNMDKDMETWTKT